jgi:cytochrome bd-type quinol oxidase subunit 1
MKTSQAASPSVTATDIWISLTVFVLLYAALGVADAYLMIHYGRKELEAGPDEGSDQRDDEGPDDADHSGGHADDGSSDRSEGPRVPALIY